MMGRAGQMLLLATATMVAAGGWAAGLVGTTFVSLLPALMLAQWAARSSETGMATTAINVAAIALGLVLDAASGAPMGYWASIYLCSTLAGVESVRYVRAPILSLAALVPVLVVLQIVVTAAYALHVPPILPVVQGSMLAAVAYAAAMLTRTVLGAGAASLWRFATRGRGTRRVPTNETREWPAR